MTIIPDGYRFLPTDEELVLKYLLKKVRGEPLSSEAVIDMEIYGDNDKEPWKIFGESSSEKFYVFTKLKKKGKGRRIERKAGCGTWKGQRTDPVKDSQNNQVGFKKLFVFEVKSTSGTKNANNGHWLMNEFSLLNDRSDYVLCTIRNKHAIVVVDNQPRPKKMRFSSSPEKELNSLVEGATPVLASDIEALSYAANSNNFIEVTLPALRFENALFANVVEDSEEETTSENFDEEARQVQILNETGQATNAHIINAQELRKRSMQQQSMVRFGNNYAMEDMGTSFTIAAESIFTSVSASPLEYLDARASASALAFNAKPSSTLLDFDAGFSNHDLLPLHNLLY
ncbi:NAC domain-containing protein 55-like [Durio zibethinus]|uniref:NAC domain-containing protein 55-like n=1 Tax=Durio zibethinus TaxID=66656 RepID=A0A6P5WGS5_DURZI|nr:NAC domain-containing protein 55-like [Durio zibethinus]